MKRNEIEEYRNIFEKACFGKIQLKTKRIKEIWLDCSLLEDNLAGPLYSIYRNGNCEYVYERNDDYFRDVNNPEMLEKWMKEILNRIYSRVSSISIKSKNENEDVELINNKINQYKEIISIAIRIELERKII